jgi:dihydrofolate reductase
MIIITRDRDFKAEGCDVVHTIEDALALASEREESEAFIIGGADIYSQTLRQADRLYLTLVHAKVEADTFFPQWNESDWNEVESFNHKSDEKNQYSFTFKLLVRKKDS